MKDRSITYRQLLNLLFLLVFLSSSFDIFLNLKLGGFSFRFVYIIVILLFVISVADMIWKNTIHIKVLGIIPFLAWSLILIIFIPNTPLLARNIGYIVWLYIHFIFIAVCGNFIVTKKHVNQIIKLYLFSFLAVALFGLLQFSLALVGISILVEQWWILGRLARINGFSYEPSYYTTYLLIGFSLAYYLFRREINLFGRLPFYTAAVSLTAIILSTSRMGILVAALQVLCFELIVNRKNLIQLLLFVVGFSVVLGGTIIYIINNAEFGFLLSGLGIMGGSDHSSAERLDGLLTQLTIFGRNPLKGYSLGGVSQAIAFEKGVVSISQETIKPYDISMNIFVEVLTASGLIGFLFFLRYIYCLLIKSTLATKQKSYNNSTYILLKAFVWSLLFELIILCFNQSILRAYLWVHIGLLNGIYFVVKTQNTEKFELQTQESNLNNGTND
ncbi:hypothetical protein GO730_21435 [Spirosoma sp. HMF3257]|uniref:O-antigen ligase-related domain-containing protein n=1 Tax=Spirosoma telluris TaxID=2183553 RepID=A0A327NN22_9BACT|nr:hypothetical protein [Spirosoma telluris]RAI76095.1 hypothetical protein HMF3257_21355 [Spirosoma telluris]